MISARFGWHGACFVQPLLMLCFPFRSKGRSGQSSLAALIAILLIGLASVPAWTALGDSAQTLINSRSQADATKASVPTLRSHAAAAIAPDLIPVDPSAAWNKPCSLFSWCTIQRIAHNSEPRSLKERLKLAFSEIFSPLVEHLGWRSRENQQKGAGLLRRLWDAALDVVTAPVTILGSLSYDVIRKGGYDLARLVRLPWNAIHRASVWRVPDNGRLFVDGIESSDVRQGLINSCLVLSGLAAIAAQHPALIEDAITDNGDGTYTVRFFEQRPPGFVWEPEWTTHEVTVDAVLPHGPDDKPVYARTPNGELWVAIMEKAWAEHMGGYQRIDGNYGQGIVEALTGKTASAGNYVIDNVAADIGLGFDLPGLEEMADALANGDVLLATSKGSSENGLVTRHVYYVQSVDVTAGTVNVGNPWGTEHDRTLSYNEFQTDFATTVRASTR